MLIRFLTLERDHIFDFTKHMILGIEPEFFQNPNCPVLISVRGASGSGKKIIADATKNILLGENAAMTGQADTDEFWHGMRNGMPLEVNYMDCNYNDEDYSQFYFSSHLKDMRSAEDFLKFREFGGVTIIQNCKGIVDRSHGYAHLCADVEIHFETADCWGAEEISRIPASSRLRHIFNALADGIPACQVLNSDISYDSEWVRYIEIKIHNEALKQSSSFRNAMFKLALFSDRALYNLLGKNHEIVSGAFNNRAFPVYGFNISASADNFHSEGFLSNFPALLKPQDILTGSQP